jgi:hypothetical protein
LSREGTPTAAASRKKRQRRGDLGGEGDTDWEANWRAEGRFGGNVAGWGKEMDREERMKRKEIEKEGRGRGKVALEALPMRPIAVSLAKGNKGQRYHGGY